MKRSKRPLVFLIWLIIGILLGLGFSGWSSSTAAQSLDSWYSGPIQAIMPEEIAVGEAVPSAAHLSLWDEDFQTMLPFIIND